jgi:hypothetical protein
VETRHTIESMRKWFKHLYIITPQIHFTIKNIAVNGMLENPPRLTPHTGII